MNKVNEFIILVYVVPRFCYGNATNLSY